MRRGEKPETSAFPETLDDALSAAQVRMRTPCATLFSLQGLPHALMRVGWARRLPEELLYMSVL